MKEIILIIFLLLGLTAEANIINAVSGSTADVLSALNSATNNDTVVIPVGTNHWTTNILWTAPANFTLMGGGDSSLGGGDKTVIIDDYAGPYALIGTLITTNYRMTGITIESGTGATKDYGTINFGGPGTVRLDHCHLVMSSASNYKAALFLNGLFGVMDHCILDLTDKSGLYFYNGRHYNESDTVGNYEWSQPTDFGGTNFFVIEDNQINGHGVGENTFAMRLFDGTSGSKVVVRFNNLYQTCLNEMHATGHAGDDRGMRALELYGNYCTASGSLTNEPNFVATDIGGGTAMVWGNSWNNVYKYIYRFNVTRKDDATYYQTDTTNTWGYAGSPYSKGVVNVSEPTVTWVSGDQFNTSWTNIMIIVDGHSRRISSTTATTMTLQAPFTGNPWGDEVSLGTLTSVNYVVGSPWDGNQDFTGYPCIDQPGRGQGDLIAGSFPNKVNTVTSSVHWPNQALEPIYIWNNLGNYVYGYSEFNPVDGGRVVINRDYYYAPTNNIQTSPTNPFNGTSGVGYGTLANRPTTCTAGVAYWATDQGSWNTTTTNPYGVQMNGASGVLYKATAANTWTLYYTPLTYPHYLVSNPTNNPPTANVNIINANQMDVGTLHIGP